MDHPRRGDRRVAEGVRDAEVADHRRSVLGDEDVARLHVAVHDPHLVRRRERRADLRPDPRRLSRGQRAVLAQQDRQRRRLDELHHDARLALVLDDIEHGHRVRVVQAGGDARLPHRPIGRQLPLTSVSSGWVRST